MILAVYGTLRRGGPANHLLLGSKFLGSDAIPAKLFSLGSFPGVHLSPEYKTVVDLYDVPSDVEKRIDKYEGFYPEAPDQSLYEKRNTLTNEGCQEVTVYVYRFGHNSAPIPSGDWFERT